MSIANLFYPNDYQLYAYSLNANQLNITLMIIQSLIFKGECQTKLNYYEEYNQTAIWNGMLEYEIKNGLLFSRIGRTVMCKIKGYLFKPRQCLIRIININKIPDRFKPNSMIVFKTIVMNNDNYEDGMVLIIDNIIKIIPGNNPNDLFSCDTQNNKLSGLPYDITLTWQIDSNNEPITHVPTNPTVEPTIKPTTEPTIAPTTMPIVEPTTEPTIAPTIKPENNKTMFDLTIIIIIAILFVSVTIIIALLLVYRKCVCFSCCNNNEQFSYGESYNNNDL